MKTNRANLLSALAACATLAAACGSDADPVSVTLTATFNSQGAENSTNSLHFWVLEARYPGVEGEAAAPSCADLRLKEAEPYDVRMMRQADLVLIREDNGASTPAEVMGGDVLVYVEGVGYAGELLLSGCEVASLGGGSEVTVELAAARTIECDDPEAEDGSPCDDGEFCTVGEECNGTSCQGGGPRNCTHLADQCNAEACSEELGCHTNPVSNGVSCEDGQYCTVNDICQDGECVAGTDRDCSDGVPECYTGYCDEANDFCDNEMDTTGTPCDDDYLCTTNEECYFGSCAPNSSYYDPYDCSQHDDDCNMFTGCASPASTCTRTPINESVSCDTNCMTGGTCDAFGQCLGGTPVAAGTEGPVDDPTCSDFVDNDCDGDWDLDDADCN